MEIVLECPYCGKASHGVLPEDPLLSFGVCCGFCGSVLLLRGPEMSWSVAGGPKLFDMGISSGPMEEFKKAIKELSETAERLTAERLSLLAREKGIVSRSRVGPALERTDLSDDEWEESSRLLKLALE